MNSEFGIRYHGVTAKGQAILNAMEEKRRRLDPSRCPCPARCDEAQTCQGRCRTPPSAGEEPR